MVSESDQDEVAQAAIYVARYFCATTPRQAAEFTAKRFFTDDEWFMWMDPWVRNWPLVPDPNSFTERTKRMLGLSRYS